MTEYKWKKISKFELKSRMTDTGRSMKKEEMIQKLANSLWLENQDSSLKELANAEADEMARG